MMNYFKALGIAGAMAIGIAATASAQEVENATLYGDMRTVSQDMLNRATGWSQALTLMKFWVEHGISV